jgi:hypothetical protein
MGVELREGDKEMLPVNTAELQQQWTFSSAMTATEAQDIKDRLSSQRLTHLVRDHCDMDLDLDYGTGSHANFGGS